VIRYVGKGRGPRRFRHERKARKIVAGEKIDESYRRISTFHKKLADALRGGSTVSSEILVSGMTEEEALDREKIEIASRPGLWNSLEGGYGWTSRDARALQLKQLADPEYVKVHAEAVRRPEYRKYLSELAQKQIRSNRGRFLPKKLET